MIIKKDKGKEEKNKATIILIIFRDFSIFYQMFLSSQVKIWAINTYKQGLYELPHKLLND